MCQSPYLYLLTSRCTHLDVDPVKVEPSLREILHLLPEELVRLELVMVMLSLRHCGRNGQVVEVWQGLCYQAGCWEVNVSWRAEGEQR